MAHGWVRMFHGPDVMYEGLFRMGKPIRNQQEDEEKSDSEEEEIAIPHDLHFSRLK